MNAQAFEFTNAKAEDFKLVATFTCPDPVEQFRLKRTLLDAGYVYVDIKETPGDFNVYRNVITPYDSCRCHHERSLHMGYCHMAGCGCKFFEKKED